MGNETHVFRDWFWRLARMRFTPTGHSAHVHWTFGSRPVGIRRTASGDEGLTSRAWFSGSAVDGADKGRGRTLHVNGSAASALLYVEKVIRRTTCCPQGSMYFMMPPEIWFRDISQSLVLYWATRMRSSASRRDCWASRISMPERSPSM